MSVQRSSARGTGEALASSTALSTTSLAALSIAYICAFNLLKPKESELTRLELRNGSDAPFFNVALETADRVLRRAHTLYLLTRTVRCARVRHAIVIFCLISTNLSQVESVTKYARMATVTVGHEFEEEGSFTRNHPVTRVFDRLRRSNEVHSVRLDTGDLISTCEVFRIGRATRCRGTHSVLVVLAYEHARQVPQFRHVERFEHLALIARAIAIERERS